MQEDQVAFNALSNTRHDVYKVTDQKLTEHKQNTEYLWLEKTENVEEIKINLAVNTLNIEEYFKLCTFCHSWLHYCPNLKLYGAH